MSTKRFTGRDLLEAIKKNNVPWRRNDFFSEVDVEFNPETGRKVKTIGSACALGVGAFNLGVEPSFNNPTGVSLFDDDDTEQFRRFREFNHALSALVSFNDHEAKSWEDIPPKAEELLAPYLDVEFEAHEREYRLAD